MTGVFSPEGRHIPVTVLRVGPCVVTQIKTVAIDGYNALQLAFGSKKKTHVNKPMTGHFGKCGSEVYAHVMEFPVDNPAAYTLGTDDSAGHVRYRGSGRCFRNQHRKRLFRGHSTSRIQWREKDAWQPLQKNSRIHRMQRLAFTCCQRKEIAGSVSEMSIKPSKT